MGNAEQDALGDDHAFYEQERAIGAEDAQYALNLAVPIRRQCSGDGFEEMEVFVGSPREQRGIPPPGRDDDDKTADESCALEGAEAGSPPSQEEVSVHGWSTVGRPAFAHQWALQRALS